jgi:hypothetical protein
LNNVERVRRLSLQASLIDSEIPYQEFFDRFRRGHNQFSDERLVSLAR